MAGEGFYQAGTLVLGGSGRGSDALRREVRALERLRRVCGSQYTLQGITAPPRPSASIPPRRGSLPKRTQTGEPFSLR